MNYREFADTYKTVYQEYCACVICWDGDVIACEESHLLTLQQLWSMAHPGLSLPEEATRMFWLIVELRAVVVDYENQVYSETLSDEQEKALCLLEERGLLRRHLSNIHKHTD